MAQYAGNSIILLAASLLSNAIGCPDLPNSVHSIQYRITDEFGDETTMIRGGGGIEIFCPKGKGGHKPTLLFGWNTTTGFKTGGYYKTGGYSNKTGGYSNKGSKAVDKFGPFPVHSLRDLSYGPHVICLCGWNWKNPKHYSEVLDLSPLRNNVLCDMSTCSCTKCPERQVCRYGEKPRCGQLDCLKEDQRHRGGYTRLCLFQKGQNHKTECSFVSAFTKEKVSYQSVGWPQAEIKDSDYCRKGKKISELSILLPLVLSVQYVYSLLFKS